VETSGACGYLGQAAIGVLILLRINSVATNKQTMIS
jgi:hypothetical protein